jgi:lipoyl(octanoyl) transferase
MEFLFSGNPIKYLDAIDFMEKRAEEIAIGISEELIWFLEHEAVLTAGTSAKDEDILSSNNLPIYKTNRGGKHTLHAPRQRICYLLLNLKKRAGGVPDPKKYVKTLENIVISSLAKIGIKGEIREDRIGVWVVREDGREEKICAIGVRFKRGVSMHGFAINVENDLSLFNSIIPCGIREYGVCSIASLGVKIHFEEFDKILKEEIVKYISKY